MLPLYMWDTMETTDFTSHLFITCLREKPNIYDTLKLNHILNLTI